MFTRFPSQAHKTHLCLLPSSGHRLVAGDLCRRGPNRTPLGDEEGDRAKPRPLRAACWRSARAPPFGRRKEPLSTASPFVPAPAPAPAPAPDAAASISARRSSLLVDVDCGELKGFSTCCAARRHCGSVMEPDRDTARATTLRSTRPNLAGRQIDTSSWHTARIASLATIVSPVPTAVTCLASVANVAVFLREPHGRVSDTPH